MNIRAAAGTKIRYKGASEDQVRYSSGNDPRKVLMENEVYTLKSTEIHSWYTNITIEEAEGKFNSVCFAEVSDSDAKLMSNSIDLRVFAGYAGEYNTIYPAGKKADDIGCRICGHRTSTNRMMIDHLLEYHPSDIPKTALKAIHQLVGIEDSYRHTDTTVYPAAPDIVADPDTIVEFVSKYKASGDTPQFSDNMLDGQTFSDYTDLNYFINKAFKALSTLIDVSTAI